MAKVLSLKLREDVFQEVEDIIRRMKTPRNTYINDAISFYNSLNRRKALQKQLIMESRAVQKNSMEVLEEFEKLEEVGVE
jgi:hypothetical protein